MRNETTSSDLSGQRRIVSRADEKGETRVGIIVRGEGPLVVLVPSLGRGAADFDDLAARLAQAGYTAAAVDPRGVGDSAGPMEGVTLFDYAADVAAVVAELSPGPAVLVGHAFGNRVVRATAARHPEAVSALVLLAAGGQVRPEPAASQALADVFDVTLPAEAHRAAVKTAFFAPGADPDVWLGGWYPQVRRAQNAAGAATDASWIAAGTVPILVVQAQDDVIAPPANAEALASAYPDRVEVAMLPRAGHAMLPEQPQAIAELVSGFLERRR
jgi:pimeloyl-ACP methyl ester carboxylesterase